MRSRSNRKGTPNKRPSKEKLYELSIDTIKHSFSIFRKKLKTETLTLEQMNEIREVFDEMSHVLSANAERKRIYGTKSDEGH